MAGVTTGPGGPLRQTAVHGAHRGSCVDGSAHLTTADNHCAAEGKETIGEIVSERKTDRYTD